MVEIADRKASRLPVIGWAVVISRATPAGYDPTLLNTYTTIEPVVLRDGVPKCMSAYAGDPAPLTSDQVYTGTVPVVSAVPWRIIEA